MTCKDCQYYQRDGADGLCRKYAPKAQIMQQGGSGYTYTIVWPKTAPHEWCGEYKKAEISDEAQRNYT